MRIENATTALDQAYGRQVAPPGPARRPVFAALTASLSGRPGYLILGLSLLAFALRIYQLGYQSLWRDEADTLRFATQPIGNFLQMFSGRGQNGPAFFLTLKAWLAVAGHSEFALRFLPACCGTLAVPAAYGLLRGLAGRKPATLLALFMVVAPYLVWYGQEAKMYALLSLLVPLSLWLAVLAVRRRRWYHWVGLYLMTSFAIYNHLLAPLVIPVQLVWILLVPARPVPPPTARAEPDGADLGALPAGNGQAPVVDAPAAPAADRPAEGANRLAADRFGLRLRDALLYAAALILPYLPILRWAAPLLLHSYSTGFVFVPLPQLLTNLAGVWSRGILPTFGATAMPMLLAAVAGAVLWIMAGGRGGWRLVSMLLAWVLLPPLGIYLISLNTPIYVDRYLIWALPGFLGLQALGIVALVHAWRPLGLLTLGAILALNLTDVGAQQARPLKSDFRSAAAYVLAHRQPGDRLIFQIPYDQYLFSYYAGPVSDAADGPYTNNGMTEAQLDQDMTSMTSGAPGVWLIAAEVPMWDDRGLTEAWLNAHGRVTDRADFTLVSVIRYQMAGP